MSGHITNLQRAAWAEQALLAYSEQKNPDAQFYDDFETVFSDMLGDLMHLAHIKDLNWWGLLERGRGHQNAEIVEESEAT
jgi:hypothetical protein